MRGDAEMMDRKKPMLDLRPDQHLVVNIIEGFLIGLLIVLGLLFCVGGFVQQVERGHAENLPARFQTDNAVGASANALEAIARNTGPSEPNWFTDALLLWLLAAAVFIQARLRVISRRLQN